MKFIGVVKTTHRKFPLKHFQSMELQKREDRIRLVRRKKEGEGEGDLLVFTWMDRERIYLIVSAQICRKVYQTSDKEFSKKMKSQMLNQNV